MISAAADTHLESVVMGMAHRGRLNVLVNIVGKSYEQLFTEFEGNVDPESTQGSGDVKYHLGQTGKFVSRNGNTIEVELAANPSHLETVDPVVEGMARAKMDLIDPPGRYPVLPILIHGDAAFAGQGVVAETLNLSLIKGYRVGGTVHLIINNQLGFTTPPDSARSSEYPTDVAKMVQAPIFHVNGDDPEACVRVAQMAFAYRQEFNKDVVIDMVCYRRHGHNEGDDPSYTQPLMYKRIDARRSVRKLYTEALVKRGDISLDDAEAALDDFSNRLQSALEETRQHAPPEGTRAKPAPPALGVLPHVATGITRAEIDTIFTALETVPDGFQIHPKLAKQFETRHRMFESGEVDWALGETMAYGSLLYEGTSVRLAGQDTRRGTFSHRHGVLVDYQTGMEHTPLAPLASDGAQFWLYDSLLSEYAALGFEYGYSVVNKDALVIWEAQFGDFFNGAQIIVDQYLVAAEDKWGQTSGLVLLLAPRLRGPGARALLRAHRAVPDAGRRGQHPGVQRHHRGPVLPPASASDAPHRAQAAGGVHTQVAPAGQGLALAHRGAGAGLVRGGPRRSPGRRSRRRQAHHPVLGQDRLRRVGCPRQARRAGGHRSGGAALPVAVRGRGPAGRALPERRPAVLASGGAREHGSLERHQGPLVRGPQRPLDPPREPLGVGIARHGQPCHPPAGAGGRGQPHLRQPRLTPSRPRGPSRLPHLGLPHLAQPVSSATPMASLG